VTAARCPLVSVIVPVFRNEATLAELHRRIAHALEGVAVAREIIFVDDGSGDGSADQVRALMRNDSDVRLLELRTNGGQQQAVLAGMRIAQGEVIATIDADLQDPPEALTALVSRIADDAVDVVFATRRGVYESAGRLRTSRLFKRAVRTLSGLPPNAGMYLVMKRAAMQAIVDAPPKLFYLPTALMRVTHRVAAIPVERAVRAAGTSQYTFFGRGLLALTALAGALWWRFGRRRPAR
jgi:glycosyltransferase involved in cell wall biosynthesis